MDENLDVLLSMAEISAALAGFAGIIIAVVGSNSSGWDPGHLARFRLMVFSSLSAIVASLIPYVFLLNSDHINWTWSIGGLGVYLFGFSTYLIRSFVLASRNLNSYVSFGVSFLAVSATLAQFAALFGLVEPDLGIYFLGVFYLFIQSCIAFIRLVIVAILEPGRSR